VLTRDTQMSASDVKDHKIILSYTATVDSNVELPDRACDGGEERIVWLTRTEVEATDKIAPGYRDFVLKWWPADSVIT
jgi:hypothetical protein